MSFNIRVEDGKFFISNDKLGDVAIVIKHHTYWDATIKYPVGMEMSMTLEKCEMGSIETVKNFVKEEISSMCEKMHIEY